MYLGGVEIKLLPDLQMKKRCVIIGSGLGGLACGVMLARNGYSVTVLEQGAQIGGSLQCFRRDGVKFETGMHFIGSAAPGQTLDMLMRYLNLDGLKLSPLDTNAYDIISLQNQRFAFANGRDPFIEQMGGYFPAEKDNLVRYYDIVQQVAKASTLGSLRHAENDMALRTRYLTVSIDEVLDSIFHDDLLKKVLVGNLPLYAAEKGKTPFSQHAFIMDFYNQSAFRIAGGSDQITKSLCTTIKSHGGEVLPRHKVTRIVCDDTHATGVEVNNETYIPADIVIADIHPARVMELLDTKLIRPAFRKRMTSLRNTAAGFAVYLKFKPGTMPYLNSNFYGYFTDTPWENEIYTPGEWPKGYLLMHFCHEAQPKYASSAVILSYMDFAEVEPWSNTTVGHRGEDYEKFKRDRAETLLRAVERDFPGLRDKIEKIYTATPLTYRDYTGTEAGSMYGVAKDINLGVAARVPHRTKVPNLLLTGQNINSHGMLGVLVGSIVTCSELLTAETIYQQIISVNE